jgi:hypothetical protein
LDVGLTINIVSFDIPYPPDYGGIIDVYYKLFWLKKAGAKIHLHCYSYGRKESPELNKLCETVSYYKRRMGLLPNFSFLPYTVKSRVNRELRRNLLLNDHPILFEVLHTCYLMKDPAFSKRCKVYRHSNIEHDYYWGLSRTEKSYWRRWYLRIEAIKLRGFETTLKYADQILAVNRKDAAYFEKKYPRAKTHYLPSFHANASLQVSAGMGQYALFHGNLSISENYEVVQWMAREVFSKVKFMIVVAGHKPPPFLATKLEKIKNVELVSDPDNEKMTTLIRNAHAHLLFTFQPTGLKLKLLNSLYIGRFVICNANMLAGTDIRSGKSLLLVENGDEMAKALAQVMPRTFTEEMIAERKAMVSAFDPEQNAQKLIGYLS